MPGTSLCLHIHNGVTGIEIFFTLHLFHRGHELFHQSAHEIDRCKQPDNLDHDFIMHQLKQPYRPSQQGQGVNGRICLESSENRNDSYAAQLVTAAMKGGLALVCQNEPQAVFP